MYNDFCSTYNIADSIHTGDTELSEVRKEKNYLVSAESNIDFVKKIPDSSLQLIVTSPPYNIGKAYEKIISIDDYVKQQNNLITLLYEKLKEGGSICWQVGNHVAKDGEIYPLDILLYPIFKNLGLTLRNRIVWHFEHGLHSKKRLSGRYETILWFTKGDQYVFNLDPIRVPSKYPNKKHFKGPKAGQLSCNPLGKNPGDVWIIPNVKANHCEKTIHPCQFPVELIERLVLSLTNKNDSVFDPYMGVGSSVIASVKNDRFGYGCDIEKQYVDIAQERLSLLEKGLLNTRPMGKPVYNPSLPSGGH